MNDELYISVSLYHYPTTQSKQTTRQTDISTRQLSRLLSTLHYLKVFREYLNTLYIYI